METNNQSYEFRGMIKSSAKKDPNSKTSNNRSRNSKRGNLWLFFGTLSLVYCQINMISVIIQKPQQYQPNKYTIFPLIPLTIFPPSRSRQTSPVASFTETKVKGCSGPSFASQPSIACNNKTSASINFPSTWTRLARLLNNVKVCGWLEPSFSLQGDSYSHKWYLEPLSIWTYKYWLVKSEFLEWPIPKSGFWEWPHSCNVTG